MHQHLFVVIWNFDREEFYGPSGWCKERDEATRFQDIESAKGAAEANFLVGAVAFVYGEDEDGRVRLLAGHRLT